MLATLHHEYNSSLLIGLLEFSPFEVCGYNIIIDDIISSCTFVVAIHVCTHRHIHTCILSLTLTYIHTHTFTHTQLAMLRK